MGHGCKDPRCTTTGGEHDKNGTPPYLGVQDDGQEAQGQGRPSSSSGLWELQEQLRDVLARGKPTYLLGDLNIDVLNAQSSDTRRYKTALSELNVTQLIDRPTHLRPNPSALDHIITNMLFYFI